MANATAYGFIGREDLDTRRVSDVGLDVIYGMVDETMAEYNRISSAILNWAEPTEVAKEVYALESSGTLQPLDEWGNPLPIQLGATYEAGYPIFGGGTAFGVNRVTQHLITVGEVNRLVLDVMRRDTEWMRMHALAAMLDNVSWPFDDKTSSQSGYKGFGNVTVNPLANGDTVTYIKRGSLTAATDDHYYAQAAAIADGANPFPTIRAELIEHPSNSGPYVAYIASSLVTTTGALAEFVETTDPFIQYGTGSDTFNVNSPAFSPDEIVGPGSELIGRLKTSNMHVVETPSLPAGYGVVMALGAPKVLKYREYPAAPLKGLMFEQHSPDGNRQESRYIRYGGFGVGNRVGAVVFQIGNATYQIPTGYNAPLAI